ncbi:hypothetical protein [Noviherbaspirillum massiliense]|uniref:hypothetical protein n=1 Tax=Noviherbaspirillum massiliense TaxID=1465823 RepID=UPI0002F34CBF|nr:hypothetical protein [Noviherbaspirillum massiliense]
MTITVRNTRPEAPQVTLFGRLNDGTYSAAVMEETGVPYSPYWDNMLEQVMVYIDPDEDQLASMLAALKDGRLEFADLQNYGSSSGGTSTIPI